MRFRLTPFVLLVAITSGAAAQEPAAIAAVSPAERVLRFQVELKLDSAQAARLRELGRTQSAALSRATAAFLRAEADLLDASRSADLVVRRTALERRSKAAIDAEMLRLRGEREVRAILTVKQNDLHGILASAARDETRESRPIWASQVAPVALVEMPAATPDSGIVRLTVDPIAAEIYVADRRVGFGRVEVRLPEGSHLIKFRTPACVEAQTIVVMKGPPLMVSHTMSCQK